MNVPFDTRTTDPAIENKSLMRAPKRSMTPSKKGGLLFVWALPGWVVGLTQNPTPQLSSEGSHRGMPEIFCPGI